MRSVTEGPPSVSREAPAVNIGDTMPDGRTPNYLSLDRQFWEIGFRHMSDPEQKNEWSKYIVANLLQGQRVRDASNLLETNRDTLRLQFGFFNMGASHRSYAYLPDGSRMRIEHPGQGSCS